MRSALREVVLDRYASHTAICPDSMRAFGAFSAARTAFGAAAALGLAALASRVGCAAGAGGPDAGSLIRQAMSLSAILVSLHVDSLACLSADCLHRRAIIF